VGEPFEVKKDRQKDREEKGLTPKTGERRILTVRQGKGDLAWVEKRLAEVEESRTERKIDEIGWAKDVREAERLAKEHNRPIYVFTYDGDFRRGRC
jgi:hypothetical protein